MAINVVGFILTRAVAQRRGAADQEANRIGLIGAVVRPPLLGVVLAAAVPITTPPVQKVITSP